MVKPGYRQEKIWDEDEPQQEAEGSRTSRKNKRSHLQSANLLKEKANAKFNKGHNEEARNLYTQALQMFPDYTGASPEEKQVIATLFCNRGATFFREKDYEGCILDCESAVKLAPEYAKAYTRRWRALMALGRVKSAKSLLEGAIQLLPREKALREDLHRTQKIVDAISNVRRLLSEQNYIAAKDAVDNQLLLITDNPEARLLAAEVEASNGLMEMALERCEVILKMDVMPAKALSVKGYITFLTGLMEPGMSLLREALKLEQENLEWKDLLRRCRTIHKDYMEGRHIAAAGRKEGSMSQLRMAMDIFSNIVDDETGFVPPKTPLFSLFLTERAEAALHFQDYQTALADARNAIETKEDNLRAWIVKGHAYIALGRAREARDELKLARRTTWGQYNGQLKEVYTKADFEARVSEADQELVNMVADSRADEPDDMEGQDVLKTPRHADQGVRSKGGTGRRGSELSFNTPTTAGSTNSQLRWQQQQQSPPSEYTDSSGQASGINREDVMIQSRKVGSGKGLGRDKTGRKNQNPNEQEEELGPEGGTITSRHYRRNERTRRRNSASNGNANPPSQNQTQSPAAPGYAEPSPAPVEDKTSRTRRGRPVMSEADLRRRMSAI
eukprot:CAMPEP_0116866036 /NCGR_PEP_ID=MMETSP0418-20121206/25799_1 /TAXON_ID=1158023 /ORGANISM="Astrosyne radiata, Strain 13vi08-1A" /LENGTH=616 /DNA_ID=CAMNT_0004501613 /DNA_START=57 /DNA_END=1908 /DNA_ORIENTATION=-